MQNLRPHPDLPLGICLFPSSQMTCVRTLTYEKHCFMTYHLPDWKGDPEPRGFVDFHTIDSANLCLSRVHSAEIYSKDYAKGKIHLGDAG